jgi:copper resistance protein C
MTWPRARRSATPLALAVLLAALATGTVLGHAELAVISPADGTTVTVTPTEIAITFTEPLDPKKSSIVLAMVGDSPILTGGVVDSADTKRMTLAIPQLAGGAYEVRWTSASALDGDLDRGITHFTFNQPASSPTDGNGSPPSVVPSASSAPASAPASAVPSPGPSAPPATPAASTSDAVIPIIVVLVALAALGLWFMRGRSRGVR